MRFLHPSYQRALAIKFSNVVVINRLYFKSNEGNLLAFVSFSCIIANDRRCGSLSLNYADVFRFLENNHFCRGLSLDLLDYCWCEFLGAKIIEAQKHPRYIDKDQLVLRKKWEVWYYHTELEYLGSLGCKIEDINIVGVVLSWDVCLPFKDNYSII